MTELYDYIVIGGGIVGVSTAWQLQQRHPSAQIAIVEKESTLAAHQTGHNSGVIHAGVYYQPGSLKAEFCRRGAEATKRFCDEYGIAVENCGKLLVATNEIEKQRMEALYQRCHDNQIDVELIDEDELRDMEPAISGLGAIKVHSTSIVDYRLVTERMAQAFTKLGGRLYLSSRVTDLTEHKERVEVECVSSSSKSILKCKQLVVCGGLMADRLAAMIGITPDFQIIPYRGEYYRLAARHNQIVKHLIYPIPDPELPFLGVHLTRMIDGSVTVGPNAVQGFKREGYGDFNVSLEDTLQMLRFKGFWKVTAVHFKTGLTEFKNSLWRPGYLQLVRKYCPSIEMHDLEPYPAGIRAQAVMSDGRLVHDFLFAETPRSLHVCNAPSPAATSAIPIGQYICEKVEAKTC
ncbi:L-2-hydroxyglutarate oxidase [Vibrio sp. SCSIO 43140]|uniref:L-2-hydroxyglutarate oxidase n=1 Tax=Vibrio sp. SCSIO 43140 TaxID=2819100 RepID=UPI00207628BE|nr:L-2-hydroxyglutarate oxidase [Vibrio sp. SCSIO 43140]USD63429.1 L-2-hydroxyglutarate oxidase [Vibrio sp. SCSIO 43140]